MAKKSLGYVELEWHCPSCGTRNAGLQKTCTNCGMPQPEDVEFVQPAQEKLITDEDKLEDIEAGPDIHCYYCGSRVAATATACSQCGADLSEGARRQSGQVLGAHRDRAAEKIKCPACETMNEADAAACVNCGASLTAPQPNAASKSAPAKTAAKKRGGFGMLGGVGLAVVAIAACACAITFFVLYNRTDNINGTVDGVGWSRTIGVEGLVPVSRDGWHDEIPAEGLVGTCTQKVRRTQDQPTSNSREVCGTPYTIDTGTGAGQVVQDCRYEVFDRYCEYTVEEWREVDEKTLSGNDYSPRWPDPNLSNNKREGEREEIYRITFKTEEGTYTFVTQNQDLFERTEVGSRWILKVNTFNTVTDIEPNN